MVSNPEFLKQGAAVDDFMKPDRVVIGAEDARGAELMRELYAPFTRTGAPIMVMDCASAELCKYAANAMLATRISFMNEIANVCELFGADVDQVRQAIGVGSPHRPVVPVPGRRLRRQLLPEGRQGARQVRRGQGLRLPDPRGRRGGQRAQKTRLRREDGERTSASLKGKTIAVWGLAFKPKTDDMREAPAIPIIEALLERGREGAGLRSRSA